MIKLNSIKSYLFPLLLIVILYASSCKKEDLFTKAKVTLGFSSDTIMFDTVFTTIGSATQYLVVRNPEDKAIRISSIKLAGGIQSQFRINVDGTPGYSHSDVEIAAKDSLYIFIEVTVDPTGLNSPLLITDSILFETNGMKQDVDLVALGQDAYFITPNLSINGLPPLHIVAGEGVDTIWTNEKPIVVYGFAVVDSTAKLTIQAGTNIYFHANSGLWVYKGGSIKVLGTKSEPVVFQGDRLEEYYKNIPGQWDRIWLNEGSIDNEFNYAVIKNGFIGIQCELLQQDMGNKLVFTNSRIENMSGAGLLARTYSVEASNSVIANCQQYLAALTLGGDYSFIHCTFANFWSYEVRKTSSIYINNYYKNPDNSIVPFNLTKVDFINCIVYGNQQEEVVLDKHLHGGSFTYLFDHCLLKTQLAVNTAQFISIKKNQNPLFKDYSKSDYHLQNNSPAIGAGKGTSIFYDLDGSQRPISNPCLGAYEFVP